MKKHLARERGQALILITLAAIGLVGIVALAIDGSAKYSDRRHAQNAADTAALAAALTKSNGMTAGKIAGVCSTDPVWTNSTFCDEIIDAAWDRAEENGYDGLLSNDVDVYSPPISGPYLGNGSYIQVVIQSKVDTYFARILGINQTQNTVEATTLAGKGGILGEGATIISYDPDPNCSTGGTGGFSVKVTGNSEVNLYGGGLFLNSDEVCGFTIPNCADLNLKNGAGISSVGGNNIDTGSCTFDPPVTKNYNEAPIIIPDDVSWPDEPPECSMGSHPAPYKFPTQILGYDNKLHDQWLIYPGYYTQFPNPTLVSNKSYIYMASGVYCIELPANQDLSWSSVDAAALIGSTNPAKNAYAAYNPTGVTLYIKQAKGFSINGNGPTFLDASTAGDYQGYLIILKGTHTYHPSCTINGGSIIDVNGLIYAPYCDFTLNGKAGETAEYNAQVIGWDITINGGNAINFNYNPDNAVKIKRKVGLVK